MVAAGGELIFGEGEKFKKAFKAKPSLVQAAKDFYVAQPGKFIRIQGTLYKGDVPFEGEVYECLILRRVGARVYLLAMAKVAGKKGIEKADLEYFKNAFGK